MRKLVENNPPDLLVCGPPCTWAGGWFHLNQLYIDPADVEKHRLLTLLLVNVCCELIETQLNAGGRALLEHPKPSVIWKLLRVERLIRLMFLIECHGLRIPHDAISSANQQGCWYHMQT